MYILAQKHRVLFLVLSLFASILLILFGYYLYESTLAKKAERLRTEQIYQYYDGKNKKEKEHEQFQQAVNLSLCEADAKKMYEDYTNNIKRDGLVYGSLTLEKCKSEELLSKFVDDKNSWHRSQVEKCKNRDILPRGDESCVGNWGEGYPYTIESAEYMCIDLFIDIQTQEQHMKNSIAECNTLFFMS